MAKPKAQIAILGRSGGRSSRSAAKSAARSEARTYRKASCKSCSDTKVITTYNGYTDKWGAGRCPACR